MHLILRYQLYYHMHRDYSERSKRSIIYVLMHAYIVSIISNDSFCSKLFVVYQNFSSLQYVL